MTTVPGSRFGAPAIPTCSTANISSSARARAVARPASTGPIPQQTGRTPSRGHSSRSLAATRRMAGMRRENQIPVNPDLAEASRPGRIVGFASARPLDVVDGACVSGRISAIDNAEAAVRLHGHRQPYVPGPPGSTSRHDHHSRASAGTARPSGSTSSSISASESPGTNSSTMGALAWCHRASNSRSSSPLTLSPEPSLQLARGPIME